ncbi:MAG: D-alanyl-D-alanine carboxypeptidase family protein [Candidatus Saccharibacteria bacterium]|nr:D-alanyl-D-alanine carboxypeptidase family protein [Candidatus Saccharibacteria bacterium]
MATDLEERNAGIYDKDKPAWKTSLDNTSETSDEGSSNDAMSSKDIQAKEKSGAKSSSTKADASEGGSLYKAGKPKKNSFKSKLSRKRAAIGFGVASTLITGFVLIFLQIPNLLVNQLKEMLIGRIGNVQMYQQRKYRQKKIPRMKNFFKPGGRMANKMVDELAADGYILTYNKGSLIGLQTSRGANGLIGTGIGDNVEAWMDQRHPFRSSRWKTKRMNALKKIYGVVSTSVVDAEKAKNGPDKDLPADNQVNKNTLQDVIDPNADGEIDELKVQGDTEGKTPEEQKVIDEKLADDTNNPLTDELKAEQKAILTEGAEVNPKGLASELGSDIITPNLADSLEKGVVNASVGSKFVDKAKGFLNPLDIVDKVCTIRTRAQGAIQLARAARSVKLIRYAMVFINAADDTRRGNASPKLINSLMKRVTSKDANGNSIGGSPGFAYMMKGKFSKSRNLKTKQSVAVDGKLTGVVGGINDKIGTFPGIKRGCPFAQNPIAQVGVGAGTLVIGFFSGGGYEAAVAAAAEAETTVIRAIVTDIISSIITKEVAGQIALGFIGEITFQGFMGYMSAYVQKQLLLPFTGQEKGGQLGDILVAGAGASNKQRSLNAGMVPATPQQYAVAETEYIAWRDTQFKNLSFKERMFNSEHPNNLMLNLALASPTSATDFANKTKDASVSLASSVLNPGKYISLLGNIFGGKVSAAIEDDVSFDSYTLNGTNGDRTELATDPAGNLQVIMRPDIEAIDPEPNSDALIAENMVDAQTLQPIAGSKFASHVENCVNNPDLITQLEEGDTHDCLAKKEETKRFKAHLAYLDTTDAFEAEFFPEDIDTPTATDSPAIGSGNNKVYTVGDSLTEGMRDLGGLRDKYTAAGWDSTDIDAKRSIRTEQAIDRVTADNAVVAPAGTVVVMLGTNPSGDFASAIKKMIDTIRSINPTANIVWMNNRTDVNDFAADNAILQSQSSALKFKVIDWSSEYVKNKASLYAGGDGVHLNPAGYAAKSTFLISQLGPPPAPQAAVAGAGGVVDLAQTSPIPGAGGNIRIATSVLPAVTAMLDAARAEGVELLPISSGWRDPQVQIALRKQNCPDWQNSNADECSPPTAKPGRSNHEKGEAIDFGNMCFSPKGSTSCPGNKRWVWLTTNASRFGFKPLSSEAWHWSTTGN